MQLSWQAAAGLVSGRSRAKNKPKQLLPLLGRRPTLFQSTVVRLEGLIPPERIYVVTVAEQAEGMRAQSPEIPAENYLIEPAPRGTASVVGLAATALRQRDPDAVMAVLPSDHFIRNRDLFHLLIRVAVDVAEKDYLVTLGITPTYAATGYGYIQRGDAIPERVVYPVYRVSKFKEKPDETTPEKCFQPEIIRGIRACSSGGQTPFWRRLAGNCRS